MVVYCTTITTTGNGELVFDSEEVALKMAATSKVGSRRVNYSMFNVEVVTIIVSYF